MPELNPDSWEARKDKVKPKFGPTVAMLVLSPLVFLAGVEMLLGFAGMFGFLMVSRGWMLSSISLVAMFISVGMFRASLSNFKRLLAERRADGEDAQP